jgi:hypothetical protein
MPLPAISEKKEAHTVTKGLLSANTTIAGLTKGAAAQRKRRAPGKLTAGTRHRCERGLRSTGKERRGETHWRSGKNITSSEQERKGQKPAGAAMAYWRENKQALDDYAASKRAAA